MMTKRMRGSTRRFKKPLLCLVGKTCFKVIAVYEMIYRKPKNIITSKLLNGFSNLIFCN